MTSQQTASAELVLFTEYLQQILPLAAELGHNVDYTDLIAEVSADYGTDPHEDLMITQTTRLIRNLAELYALIMEGQS